MKRVSAWFAFFGVRHEHHNILAPQEPKFHQKRRQIASESGST
jgi:hypothetical protein